MSQPSGTDSKRSYEELLKAYSELQAEHARLVAEVTRLKTDVADLSYGKLTNSQPISPDQNSPPSSDSVEEMSIAGLLAKLIVNPRSTSRMIMRRMNGRRSIAGLSEKVASRPEDFAELIMQLVNAGRRDEAQKLVEEAVKATRGQPDLHMRWVRQLRYSKEYGLAITLCNLCFVADRDSPLLRLNRGYLLYEAGHFAPAADDLDIAASQRPESIEEKLVAAAARKRLGQRVPVSQKQIIVKFFDSAKATFSARNINAADIKQSLARYGCAWIQGLFSPEELGKFDRNIEANREGMLDIYRQLGVPESFLSVGFPLYFAADANRERNQQCFKASYPSLFDPAKMGGVDNRPLARFVFANLKRAGLDAVVRDYLHMQRLYVSAAACHIRHMVPQGIRAYGEFHQDNRLYNSDAEILTLWFPFRYQHGPMPSLEFLPVRSDSHFPCVSVCGIDNELMEPEVFWRPEYKLGDAVLLSGFSPHRTYFEPSMTVERTSIDFRIFASPLPEPIYEDEPA
jgi:tetratricopeptide (TPR) repeat protein